MEIVGEAGITEFGSVETNVGNVFKNAFGESISEFAAMLGIGVAAGFRFFECDGHADDPGHILSTGAASALLPAAVLLPGHRDAFADVKQPHAFRPVEFVS